MDVVQEQRLPTYHVVLVPLDVGVLDVVVLQLLLLPLLPRRHPMGKRVWNNE
jgi:hypothetical protein